MAMNLYKEACNMSELDHTMAGTHLLNQKHVVLRP